MIKPIEPDWNKIVMDLYEIVSTRIRDIERNLENETNALKFIELKALLQENKNILKVLKEMPQFYKKIKVDDELTEEEIKKFEEECL